MNTGISPRVIWILGISLVIFIIILIALRISSIETPIPTEIPSLPDRTPVISPTSSPAIVLNQHSYPTVRLAWFYKPPDEALLPTIAENFDLFILTHKDEAQRDALKSLGVKSPIFLYLQLLEIKDPGSCSDTPQGNQVAYQAGDFCEISEQHPDWFLLDQSGNRIVDNSSVYMDPGNAEYRAFWLQRARALQEQYHWDGFFIDNLEASLSKISSKGIVTAKYPDDASYQAAIEGFLKYLRQNYFEPRRQPVLANIISIKDWNVWLRYLQYLDGAMIEAFTVDWSTDYLSPSEWESELDAVDKALSQGKTLILVSQAEQPDSNRQQFALASYLLITNGNAFFRYADAGGYRKVLLYKNYSLNLGEPLGPRYQKGSSWRRDFTNGFVLVNPETQRAEIKLNP
jgi:hypothetical protein